MDKSTNPFTTGETLSSVTTYQAGIMQATTHRLLQKYCDKILNQYGITKMHRLIIGTVLDSGADGERVTDIAEKLDTTLSYLTTTINLLESKKILTRKSNGKDSRSKIIQIHRSFAPKCAEIEKTLRKELRGSIYANIDPKDFLVYMKVLYKLSEIDG